MPYKCCVPNCKGNYPKGPKVAVFGFPKEYELKLQWIQAIKRHFTPSNSSKVCELHFHNDMIERKTVFQSAITGEVLEAPLKTPRLIPGAIPSILADYTSYLSKLES